MFLKHRFIFLKNKFILKKNKFIFLKKIISIYVHLVRPSSQGGLQTFQLLSRSLLLAGEACLVEQCFQTFLGLLLRHRLLVLERKRRSWIRRRPLAKRKIILGRSLRETHRCAKTAPQCRRRCARLFLFFNILMFFKKAILLKYKSIL